jgi:DNA-binding MarR family transcriptional regulator
VGPQANDWVPAALEELLPSLAEAVHRIADGHPNLTVDPRSVHRLGCYLQQVGVDAFGGVYPSLLASYAVRFYDCEIDDDTVLRTDQHREYLEGLRDDIVDDLVGFCSRRGLYDAGVDDLDDGPLRLLALGDVTPRITIELDAEAWRCTDHRETRQRSLDALAALSRECHVDLVVPPSLYAYLDRRHPEWCDAHLATADYLTDEHTTRQRPPDSGDATELQEAWAAVREFQSQGGRVRLLANVPADEGCEERDLVQDTEVDLAESSVTAYLGDLETAGLLTVDRRGRYNEVHLTPLGRATQELVTPEYRLRHPAQTDLVGMHLTPAPQRSEGTVCPADPASTMEGEDGPADPSAEAWLTSTSDAGDRGFVQWLGDADGPRQVRPWDLHRRLLAPDRVDGVNLVDDPVREFEDGRVSYLSCFEDEALAVAQWGGSLVTLVRLATTLFSPKAFNKLLTPSALGDEFRNVFDGDLDDVLGTLQQRTQIGWLREEQLEYDEFRSRFLGVRAHLLERLGELANSTDYEKRAALFEDAHGFLTCATHLYRAVGIDLTITLRFPDTETLLRKDDVREDFQQFVRHTVPKQGAYGVHSAYRCMFESREDKVNFAMSPEVDPEDPAATPTTSWIFAGPSISSAEEVVRDALEATAEDDQLDDRSHDPISFDIPVAVANTYAGIRHVVEQFAERKAFDADRGSRDLRHLVRVLLAVTGRGVLHGSPYDVAEAMLHVASATEFGQHIQVRDLEHGLAQLPAARLLPDLPPSVGKIVQVLLRADDPLGRSTIVERAGISGSTYDRRIGELAAFDFVERTDDRKWRGHLSPWFVREGDRRHPDPEVDVEWLGFRGVLWNVLERGEGEVCDEEVLDALGGGKVDCRALRDAVEWLDSWWEVLETLTAHLDGCADQGLLGEDPTWIRLGEPPPGVAPAQAGLPRQEVPGVGRTGDRS